MKKNEIITLKQANQEVNEIFIYLLKNQIYFAHERNLYFKEINNYDFKKDFPLSWEIKEDLLKQFYKNNLLYVEDAIAETHIKKEDIEIYYTKSLQNIIENYYKFNHVKIKWNCNKGKFETKIQSKLKLKDPEVQLELFKITNDLKLKMGSDFNHIMLISEFMDELESNQITNFNIFLNDIEYELKQDAERKKDDLKEVRENITDIMNKYNMASSDFTILQNGLNFIENESNMKIKDLPNQVIENLKKSLISENFSETEIENILKSKIGKGDIKNERL